MKKKKLKAFVEKTVKETVNEMMTPSERRRMLFGETVQKDAAPKPKLVDGTAHLASKDAWASP